MKPIVKYKTRFSDVVTTAKMKKLAKFAEKNKKYDYIFTASEFPNGHWDVKIESPDLSIDHNGNVRIKYVHS